MTVQMSAVPLEHLYYSIFSLEYTSPPWKIHLCWKGCGDARHTAQCLSSMSTHTTSHVWFCGFTSVETTTTQMHVFWSVSMCTTGSVLLSVFSFGVVSRVRTETYALFVVAFIQISKATKNTLVYTGNVSMLWKLIAITGVKRSSFCITEQWNKRRIWNTKGVSVAVSA